MALTEHRRGLCKHWLKDRFGQMQGFLGESPLMTITRTPYSLNLDWDDLTDPEVHRWFEAYLHKRITYRRQIDGEELLSTYQVRLLQTGPIACTYLAGDSDNQFLQQLGITVRCTHLPSDSKKIILNTFDTPDMEAPAHREKWWLFTTFKELRIGENHGGTDTPKDLTLPTPSAIRSIPYEMGKPYPFSAFAYGVDDF